MIDKEKQILYVLEFKHTTDQKKKYEDKILLLET